MGQSNLIRCQNGHLFSKRSKGPCCLNGTLEPRTQGEKETKKGGKIIKKDWLKVNIKPYGGWLGCI